MLATGKKKMNGNEETDFHPKEKFNTHFIRPEPFCDISKSHTKEEFYLTNLSPKKAKQFFLVLDKNINMGRYWTLSDEITSK